MKKILGWVLVICGIISFPGFIANISKARYGYEVIGMIIGQGLIFLLAYLCLRSKKEENKTETVYVQVSSEKKWYEGWKGFTLLFAGGITGGVLIDRYAIPILKNSIRVA